MTTAEATLPAAPPADRVDAADALSLEQRIELVEQRLVARELRVKEQFSTLFGRVHRTLAPRRLALSLAGVTAAIAALAWLMRGGIGRLLDAATEPSGARAGTSADTPWLRLIGLAWPLLPMSWRTRVNPAVVSITMAFGLPFLQRVMAQRAGPPLETMTTVNLARQAGTWYAQAWLPTRDAADCGDAPARRYTLHGGSRMTMRMRCRDARGRLHETRATARAVVGSSGAQLQFSTLPRWLRWLPMAWRDEWTLHVDDLYREMVVGSPDRRTLWLLSRSPSLSRVRLQGMVQLAHDRGFDIGRLRYAEPF